MLTFKIAYTAFVLLVVAIWWRHYSWRNFLWFSDIAFILDAAKLNSRLSDAGMSGDYGLHIGATLNRQVGRGLLSDDLQTRILVRSSAASDARMGGVTLPAMSNSGSGNQGIAATLPVVIVAEHVKADEETLARALMLSHLMAIYIHSRLPKLSALCAVTTASRTSGCSSSRASTSPSSTRKPRILTWWSMRPR